MKIALIYILCNVKFYYTFEYSRTYYLVYIHKHKVFSSGVVKHDTRVAAQSLDINSNAYICKLKIRSV